MRRPHLTPGALFPSLLAMLLFVLTWLCWPAFALDDDDDIGDPGGELFGDAPRASAAPAPTYEPTQGVDEDVAVEPIDDSWFHLKAWSSDTAEINLAAHVGGAGAFFFLGGGVDLTSPGGFDDTRFQVGGGFGARLPIDPVFIDFDLSGYSLIHQDGDVAEAALTKARLGLGYRFAPHFAIYAGATANFFFDIDLRGAVPEDLEMFTDEVPDTRVEYPTYIETTYSTSLGDPLRVSIWPGFYVGIEI